mmetsp:Transcript_34801/g.108937  ORF Transcript_34801/g.108937 Transcript_34801/m.108937 type:complete len:200 (-) Transcript_34801:445-1044(-)
MMISTVVPPSTPSAGSLDMHSCTSSLEPQCSLATLTTCFICCLYARTFLARKGMTVSSPSVDTTLLPNIPKTIDTSPRPAPSSTTVRSSNLNSCPLVFTTSTKVLGNFSSMFEWYFAMKVARMYPAAHVVAPVPLPPCCSFTLSGRERPVPVHSSRNSCSVSCNEASRGSGLYTTRACSFSLEHVAMLSVMLFAQFCER